MDKKIESILKKKGNLADLQALAEEQCYLRLEGNAIETLCATLTATGGGSVDCSATAFSDKAINGSYMHVTVSRERRYNSIIPKIEIGYGEILRNNSESVRKSYSGTLTGAESVKADIGRDIYAIHDAICKWDEFWEDCIDVLMDNEDTDDLGDAVIAIYDEMIGTQIISRQKGLLFYTAIEFDDDGFPTGDVSTKADVDEVVTNLIFKSDRKGSKSNKL